jgi:hypothetical protein
MQAHSFSLTSEFTGWSIKAKCEPMKKYKRAPEKRMSEPVKFPYGVGRYWDMAVSPTRSHLLWAVLLKDRFMYRQSTHSYRVLLISAFYLSHWIVGKFFFTNCHNNLR